MRVRWPYRWRELSGLGRAVRRAIRAAGAKLSYLPPYGPDLNPIEQAFSKLKILFRKENVWNIERVEKCIAKLLMRFACAQLGRPGLNNAPRSTWSAD